MAHKIAARPHLNGNTPAQFQEASHALYRVGTEALDALAATTADILHGRNYQHLAPEAARAARAADVAAIQAVAAALEHLQTMALDLHHDATA